MREKFSSFGLGQIRTNRLKACFLQHLTFSTSSLEPLSIASHTLLRNTRNYTSITRIMSEEAASSSSSTNQFNLNIKGPSDLKLAITIGEDATVEQLKEAIAQKNADFPKDNQRLIFSGRVLANDKALGSYGVKNGSAIHLVSSYTIL